MRRRDGYNLVHWNTVSCASARRTTAHRGHGRGNRQEFAARGANAQRARAACHTAASEAAIAVAERR